MWPSQRFRKDTLGCGCLMNRMGAFMARDQHGALSALEEGHIAQEHNTHDTQEHDVGDHDEDRPKVETVVVPADRHRYTHINARTHIHIRTHA